MRRRSSRIPAPCLTTRRDGWSCCARRAAAAEVRARLVGGAYTQKKANEGPTAPHRQSHDRRGFQPSTRFGLAAKLFAILLVLGAVAVLITGVLGYIRARDALEQSHLQSAHLGAAKPRQTRSRPTSAASAPRCVCWHRPRWWSTPCAAFAGAVDELDAKTVPPEVRQKVSAGTIRIHAHGAPLLAQNTPAASSTGRSRAILPAGLVYRRQSPSQGTAQAAHREPAMAAPTASCMHSTIR
jgi:hypothetical protein